MMLIMRGSPGQLLFFLFHSSPLFLRTEPGEGWGGAGRLAKAVPQLITPQRPITPSTSPSPTPRVPLRTDPAPILLLGAASSGSCHPPLPRSCGPEAGPWPGPAPVGFPCPAAACFRRLALHCVALAGCCRGSAPSPVSSSRGDGEPIWSCVSLRKRSLARAALARFARS